MPDPRRAYVPPARRSRGSALLSPRRGGDTDVRGAFRGAPQPLPTQRWRQLRLGEGSVHLSDAARRPVAGRHIDGGQWRSVDSLRARKEL